MIGKRKRQILAALLVLCLSAFFMFAACDGKVQLTDFADATITCDYGETFTLDLSPVKDNKGNEYTVTAEVRDADGERVGVFNGTFDIGDIRGYTIKYSARSGETVVGERTVTISVRAIAEPSIVFSSYSESNVYEIGKEFKLPAYTASSPFTDNVTSSAKLLYAENGGETDVTSSVKDGAFTPAKAGSYAYRVTADDGLGNTASLSTAFEIRPAAETDEIEAFGHELSLKNVKTDAGELAFDSIDYQAGETHGVTGSIKLGVSQKWPFLYLRARQNIDTEKYPFISFKIFVEKNDGMNSTNKTLSIRYPGMDPDTQEPFTRKFIIQTGEWEEVFVSSEHFVAEASENGGYGLLFSFINDTVAANEDYLFQDMFDCYIADIRMAEENKPAENEILDLTSDSALHNVHAAFESQYSFGFDFALTDAAIGGNTDTKLKLTNLRALADYPTFFVKPVRGKEFYAEKGYTHVLTSLYIDGVTLKEGKLSKNLIFLSTPGPNINVSVPANTWVNVAVPLDEFYAAGNKEGYTALFLVDSASAGWKDVGMTMYVGGINVIKAQAGDGDVLVQYDDSAYAALSAKGLASGENKHSAAAVGIVSDVIGEQAGEKLVVNGPASEISLHVIPPKTLAEYYDAGKDSIRFSLYVPASSLAAEQTELEISLAGGEMTKLVAGEWKKVDVRLDKLFGTAVDGVCKLFSYENLSGKTELYVTEMQLVKLITEPTVDIGALPESNVYEIGAEFLLPETSVLGGSPAVTKRLFLKKGGEETELTDAIVDGKFTPTEAGEYVYRVTAKDGLEEASDEIAFRIRAAAVAGEVESFDDELAMKNVFNHSNHEFGFTEATYCPETIDGVTGSVRYHSVAGTNKWPHVALRPRQSIDAEVYPYIVFKIYISSEGWSEPRLKWLSFTGGSGTAVSIDEWTEISISTADFNATLAGSDVNKPGYGVLFGFVNDPGGFFQYPDTFTCYISDVRAVAKNIPQGDRIVDTTSDSAIAYLGTNEGQWGYSASYLMTDETVGERAGRKVKVNYCNTACGEPTITVKSAKDVTEFINNGYTHAEISFFIDSNSVDGLTEMNVWEYDGLGGYTQVKKPVGVWESVRIPLANYVTADGYVNALTVLAAGKTNLTIYIDGITAVKEG